MQAGFGLRTLGSLITPASVHAVYLYSQYTYRPETNYRHLIARVGVWMVYPPVCGVTRCKGLLQKRTDEAKTRTSREGASVTDEKRGPYVEYGNVSRQFANY